MMNNTRPNKRRIYFIDKAFQAKFILKFCFLVLLGGILTAAVLYFFTMRSATISIVDSRVAVRSTLDFLLPVLIQTLLVVMVLMSLATVFVTLFVSHKIAGPLYRFRKELELLGEGNFSSNFGIRSTDQLKELSSALNDMITKTRSQIKTLKDDYSCLREKLDSIQDDEVFEQKRTSFNELKVISRGLNQKIDYFKT